MRALLQAKADYDVGDCVSVASTEQKFLMRRAPCEYVLLVVLIVCPEPDKATEALDDRSDDSIVPECAPDFLA